VCGGNGERRLVPLRLEEVKTALPRGLRGREGIRHSIHETPTTHQTHESDALK
jgi:hypothetical protein